MVQKALNRRERRLESPLVIQGRVLFALVMRETATRFGRSAGGYIWAVVEPTVTVALLSIIFSQISRHPPLGGSFPMFFASGYMAFHVYRDISAEVSNAINANKALLSFPRVTIIDTIIARFILQGVTSVFVSFLVLTGLYLVASDQALIRFGPILLALLAAATLGLGVGALNCLLFPYSPTWQRAFNLINRPLFLISGVFFLYEDLPRYIQELIWWNPLIHITAMMREGFYPTYAPVFVSVVYPLSLGAGLLFLAVLLLRRLRGEILER
jgi:capsular polysaccharide transport system permease protein